MGDWLDGDRRIERSEVEIGTDRLSRWLEGWRRDPSNKKAFEIQNLRRFWNAVSWKPGEQDAVIAATTRHRATLEYEQKALRAERAEEKRRARQREKDHAEFMRAWIKSPRVVSRIPEGLDVEVEDDGQVNFSIDGEVVDSVLPIFFNSPERVYKVLMDWGGKFFRFSEIAP